MGQYVRGRGWGGRFGRGRRWGQRDRGQRGGGVRRGTTGSMVKDGRGTMGRPWKTCAASGTAARGPVGHRLSCSGSNPARSGPQAADIMEAQSGRFRLARLGRGRGINPWRLLAAPGPRVFGAEVRPPWPGRTPRAKGSPGEALRGRGVRGRFHQAGPLLVLAGGQGAVGGGRPGPCDRRVLNVVDQDQWNQLAGCKGLAALAAGPGTLHWPTKGVPDRGGHCRGGPRQPPARSLSGRPSEHSGHFRAVAWRGGRLASEVGAWC